MMDMCDLPVNDGDVREVQVEMKAKHRHQHLD